MSVLLVLILAISGTSFLQHGYLEQSLVLRETDNQAAFYLANAGLERGLSAFNISISSDGGFAWTPVLSVIDPDPALCPDVSQGCGSPPFGSRVLPPDYPFDAGGFDRGEYAVRAINNGGPGDQGIEDGDSRVNLRARGTIGGEEKIIQILVQADSGLKLVNCDRLYHPTNGDCPTDLQGSDVIPLPGREPASFSAADLPVVNPSFFSQANHYPWTLTPRPITTNTTLTSITIQSGSFYFNSNPSVVITLDSNADANRVVVYSEGPVVLDHGTDLTDSVIVGLGGVTMNHGASVRAPLPYPAVVSQGNISLGNDHGVDVFGTVYSSGGGVLAGHGTRIYGMVIGVGGAVVLDNGTKVDDEGNRNYYAVMPGFQYDETLVSAEVIPDTWRELQ